MYERNAIVLERYFNQKFGYNMENNIKTNFKDYCELVDCLERYKNATDEEDEIMQEYDMTANKIREIQKKQEMLNKKNAKYQDDRKELFLNIDDNSDAIRKKFNTINENINEINEQIKENGFEFIEVVTEFNEKSNIRTKCGKARRNIEGEYNKTLNKSLDDYKEIDINIEKEAKQFKDAETEAIEEQLMKKIKTNGDKEKTPFNMEVISKAITFSIDVQKRETEILTNIYDKTNKLFNEIKNNATKIDKHKKVIKDAKCKLEFVGAIKEYLVQFLDNERLTAVNGKEEHEKLMKQSCKDLEDDLVQINNLYTLLLKEIANKITKKSYSELYNIEYLRNLEKKSEEFDHQIKKLNLPVAIINPDYWRIEGMKKIYDVFYKNVTEVYERDLSEYMPQEVEQWEDEDWEDEEIEENEEELDIKPAKKSKRKIKNFAKEESDSKNEIDKKIDLVLGFDDREDDAEESEEDEDWENEESQEDDDEVYYDIWGNDMKDGKSKINYEDDFEDDDDDFDFGFDEENDEETEGDNDDNDEDDDDEWDDDEIAEDEDDFEDEWDDEEDDEEVDDEQDEEEDFDDESNDTDDDEWGNEFINVEDTKKKSFFDKFKK